MENTIFKPFPNPYIKGGRTWKTIQRIDNVVLLEVDNSWEVCVLVQAPATVIMGNFVEAKERLPSSESWGKSGWTFSGAGISKEEAFAKAQEKLHEIAEREKLKKLVDNGEKGDNVPEMKDQIKPEFKERIKAALRRADESVKGLSVNELQELAEKGYEIANKRINPPMTS